MKQSLFSPDESYAPLADRLRPHVFGDIVGQEHLTAERQLELLEQHETFQAVF